eukprot:Gb_22502 [translate_table: standard]
MENVDIFNAATAPLTFHDFLERMRHPSAADLVRSIKSFIVSFSSNVPDPERDSESAQEFLSNMEGAFKAHPLWAGATEEELDSAGEGLEKYLMTKLFNRAFASLPEDVKRDQEISEKMSLVQQFIRPEHLEILPNFQNETSWLLAQKELQKINTYKAPRDKLVCILNCCRVINNLLLNVSMATNDNPPGADEFLPVLIYVTIKANPPQLHSNLLYIQRYRRQSRLVSEAAYFFTNLVSAASFIENIDAKSLSMDEGEFERNMQAARLALNGTTSIDHSIPDVLHFTSDSTEPKTQAPKVHQKEGNEELQPIVGEHLITQTSAKQAPVFVGYNDKRNVKDNLEESKMSVLKLENKGAVAVLNADRTGQLFRHYPFLYASAGDLRVEDVESLLSAYKELVLKYVSLSKAVESSLSHKAQAPFVGDLQSRKADLGGIKKTVDQNEQDIRSTPRLSAIDEDGKGSQVKDSNQLVMKHFDGDSLQVSTESNQFDSLATTSTGNTNGEEPAFESSKTTDTEQVNIYTHGDSSRTDCCREIESGGNVVSISDSGSPKADQQPSVTSSETLLFEASSHDKEIEAL